MAYYAQMMFEALIWTYLVMILFNDGNWQLEVIETSIANNCFV